MYATSKLIIPAKIARDSPYVPKIRICLRPSSSLDNNFDMGSSLGSDDLLCDTSQSVNNSNELDTIEREDVRRLVPMETLSQSSELQKPSKMEILQSDQSHGNRRRRSIASLNSIDLEGKDSILTKIGLKHFINKETFVALPPESRRKLLSLLPIYDQTMPQSTVLENKKNNNNNSSSSSYASSSTSADHSSCWIHPTALNNEFLSKALRDYTARQINRKSSCRSGLRKTVGNRLRYSSLAKDDVADSPFKASINQTLEAASSSLSSKNNQNSCQKRSSAANSSPSHLTHKTSLTTSSNSSCYKKSEDEAVKVTESGERIGTRLSWKRKAACPTSIPQRLLFQPNSCPKFEEDGEGATSENEMIKIDLPSNSPPSSTSSLTATLMYDKPKLSRLESTLQNGGKPCFNDDFWQEDTKKRVLSSNNGNEFASKLVVDSIAANQTATPVMPPPRQTKTLHSMREKLRAKRLLRASQQGQATSTPQPLPPGSLTPNPGASHTGNFYSSPPQAIHTPILPPQTASLSSNIDDLLNSQLPKLDIFDSVACDFIPAGFLSGRPHEPLTIQPPPHSLSSSESPLVSNMQYSVSAPATPHHDRPSFEQPNPPLIRSSMTSARESPATKISYPQLPELLASFKQARVVLQQSRGSHSSSLSSETDTLSLPQDDAIESIGSTAPLMQLSLSQPLVPNITTFTNEMKPSVSQLQAAAVSSDVSPGGLTISVNPPVSTNNNNNGAPAGTTRAFIVDGSNLSKTLALFQRINPQATVTQQQFLLIRSTDKSHAILCRTPVPTNNNPAPTTSIPTAIQPKPTEPSEIAIKVEMKPEPRISGAASFPSFNRVIKDIAPSGSNNEYRRTSMPSNPLPLILPATRPSPRSSLVTEIQRPIHPSPSPIIAPTNPVISEGYQLQFSNTQGFYREILPSPVDYKPPISREPLISMSRMPPSQQIISSGDNRRMCEPIPKNYQSQPIATSTYILNTGALVDRNMLIPAHSSQQNVQSIPMSTHMAFPPLSLVQSVVSLSQSVLSSQQQTPQQHQFQSPSQHGQHQPGNVS